MARGRTWKLLLVEDDTDSAEALMSLFELHDIETLWSVDGRAALQALDSIERLGDRAPDFALLDLNLPNTDTVRLGRDLIAHSIGCPVVLVSASSSQLLEKAAGEIGAVGTLRKPFSMDGLVETLRQHAHSAEERELSRQSAAPR